MYETAEQEYGEITVANASGSTSYSNTSDFHEDFSNGEIGNEGVGSGLTELQKATVQTYANNTIQQAEQESEYDNTVAPIFLWINVDNAPITFEFEAVKEQIEELLRGIGIRATVLKTTKSLEQISDNIGFQYDRPFLILGPRHVLNYGGFVRFHLEGGAFGQGGNGVVNLYTARFNYEGDSVTTTREDWTRIYTNVILHELLWHGVLGKFDPWFSPRNGSLAGASRSVLVDLNEYSSKIQKKLK